VSVLIGLEISYKNTPFLCPFLICFLIIMSLADS